MKERQKTAKNSMKGNCWPKLDYKWDDHGQGEDYVQDIGSSQI